MKNKYLDVLGLSPGASSNEIRSAYRRLAKVYHPDVNKNPDARKSFIEINEAYSFLTSVDPRPNQESVNYDFDPQAEAYDFLRERARAYAQQKAKEAEEYYQSAISRLNNYGRWVVFLGLGLALLMATDYLLAPKERTQQIRQVESVVERFSDKPYQERKVIYYLLTFDNYTLRIDQNDLSHVVARSGNEATISASPLLNNLRSATIREADGEYEIRPGFSYYLIDLILIPAGLVLTIFYFRLPPFDHNRITIALLMLVVVLVTVFTAL